MRKFIHLGSPLVAIMVLAMAGTGCTAKMKASYHLRRANSYFDSGQYDQAAIEYKNVLRNNQQNALAWSRLGTIYFEEGRLGEAIQILGRAQQLDATNLDVRLKLTTIYLGGGKFKEAWDEASFVLDKAPGDAQAPILLAEASATADEIAEARSRLQKILQTGETAPLEVASGILSYRQHDFKNTEACFNAAVKLDPKFSEVYTAMGNWYVAQNDLKQADSAFKAAAELSPVRSGKALQYAQFKIVTEDPGTGKRVLQDIVKQAPDYLPAWIALAQLAAAEKNYAEGVTLLDNVLSRDPQNLEGLMLKGRLELEQNETAQAINDFEELAKMFPQVPAIYYEMAQARLANNETDKAVGNLNQALNLNPSYPDAILSLAEIQIQKGDVASAIVSLQQLTQQQPQIVPAQLLLADAYRAQGRLDSAIQIYTKLEMAYPQNPQFPFLLGTALLQQKKNAEAHMEFDEALRLSPNYFPALEQLVDLDLMEKQYTVAQQLVQQKIMQNPKGVALQLLLANVLVARGDTNQAESALSKAIELKPDAQQAYLILAQIYIAENQNQKALAVLRTALDKNPKDLQALMLLGMTYNAVQNYNDARDAYEKLLALAPNNVVAMNNLAYLYAENLGQLDNGYKLASQARDLAPTDSSIADTLGWILYQKGQYSSAVRLLQESAAKLYAVPEAQFHLGMAYYMIGDEANAKATFQRALQLNGDFPETNECNQCLSVLAIDSRTAGTDKCAWLEKQVASRPNDSIALMKLAAIYQREGTVDKAIATYEAALQASPQNVGAMLNLAQLYAPQDPQKAFNFAKSAYNLTPNDPVVTHILGRLAFLTGDYEWSLSLLQLTAQAQPQDPEVLYDFGETLYSVGRVPDARIEMQNALQTGTAFSRAGEASRFLAMTDLEDKPTQALAAQSQVEAILKTAPDDVPALMVKAVIAEQKSDSTAAEQTYEDVLKHYPDFAPAQKDIAILYAKDPNNDAKAYPLAVKALAAFPADPNVDKALGLIVFRQGDYSHAANLLQESARQMSGDADVMYFLGMAQYHLKNPTGSKASLQRALALNLSNAQAIEAKRILAELK
jgi:tetratricopeptide (TPR) repeat protein